RHAPWRRSTPVGEWIGQQPGMRSRIKLFSVKSLRQQERERERFAQAFADFEDLLDVALTMIGIELQHIAQSQWSIVRMHARAIPVIVTGSFKKKHGHLAEQGEKLQAERASRRIRLLMSQFAGPRVLVVARQH